MYINDKNVAVWIYPAMYINDKNVAVEYILQCILMIRM